jgi:HAD superfamily hydrolase (TIGR01509 family)
MKIQAFFWDYDNTLLETAEAHWHKHCVVLAKHGIHLDEKYRQKVYENNGNQNWEWMREELGLTLSQKEYLKEIDIEFLKHLNQLQLRPGVLDLMAFIKRLNIPQAIITNARKDSAGPILEQKGIASEMQFILFKEDYEERKPHPMPYLEGFKRMETIIGTKIFPNRCVAVEDDPKGVEAAHHAGAIVIHRKLSEKEPDCAFADYSCYHEQDFVRIVKGLLAKG